MRPNTNVLLFLQAENRTPPTHSRSGRLIEGHHPYTSYPLIGYDAPSVDVIAGRSKQAHKRVTKKTSRRVRARIELADPPMLVSAETSAVPPPQATRDIDTQVVAQARAAAASLLLEAVQVNLCFNPPDCCFDINPSYL